MIASRFARWATAPFLLLCAFAVPVGAGAQQGPLPGGDGYLFGRPQGTVSLHLGYAQPTAQSDVFKQTSQLLTVNRRDFGSPSIALDVGVRGDDRYDVQFGAAWSGSKVKSEFRDYIDNNDLPIEQSTSFQRASVTLGMKYYLTSPGRTLGRLVWVPSKVTPFVTAGAGVVWYEFAQKGDFVDFKTLDVFPSELSSSSWAPTIYGSAGTEFSLRKDMGLITELRYDFARARMGEDFEGFNNIDLSGLAARVGITFRF